MRETRSGFCVAYIFGVTSPINKIKNVTTTTCIIKPSKGSVEKSNKPSMIKLDRITIAILIKLTLIKSVASNRFDPSISERIRSSVFSSEVFNSSISVGDKEKKADSAADTSATMSNNKSIPTIANRMLAEKGFKRVESNIELLKKPGTSKIIRF